METVKATLWIYGLALERTLQLVLSNWLVGLALLAYSMIFTVASIFLLPLGLIGGILLGLTVDACISSSLYLIENILTTGKATLDDFLKGFAVYLWEVVRITFLTWIPLMIASRVLASTPNGGILLICLLILLFVFLNAVPELLYQTRASGFDLLSGSYQFILDNWIEWFPPTLLMTIAGYGLLSLLTFLVLGLPSFLQILIDGFILGLGLTFFMVFRGALFTELNGTTRRNRVYRYKIRSSD